MFSNYLLDYSLANSYAMSCYRKPPHQSAAYAPASLSQSPMRLTRLRVQRSPRSPALIKGRLQRSCGGVFRISETFLKLLI
jgi:hypothetical protein